jgi:4a-hydroxytetrahydrobiopterin dehydratase
VTGLADRHAYPDGTAPRLTEDQIDELATSVPAWSVEDGKLTREVQVQNFRAALALVNRLGEIAEHENHHPDLCVHGWNHVRIELYTHTAHGISENDFIMAAKFDRVISAFSNPSG